MKMESIPQAKELIACIENTQELLNLLELSNAVLIGYTLNMDFKNAKTGLLTLKDADKVALRATSMAIGFDGDAPPAFTAQLLKDTLIKETKKALASLEAQLSALG